MNTNAPAKPISQSSAPRSASIESRGVVANNVFAAVMPAVETVEPQRLSLCPLPSGEGTIIGALPSALSTDYVKNSFLHGTLSIRVLGLGERERRARQNRKVEQHRPVLDVVEVVLYAPLDLFL